MEYTLIEDEKLSYYDLDILDSLIENGRFPLGLVYLAEIKDYLYLEKLEEITVPVTIDLKKIREEIMRIRGDVSFH